MPSMLTCASVSGTKAIQLRSSAIVILKLAQQMERPMTLEQNKQVALDALRVLETGDSVAADRIIAPDFINREADEDPNRPDRGLRGPAGVIATSRWLSGWVSDLRFDDPEVIAEDERVAVVLTMTGTHTGTIHGVPPTGKRFRHRQFHLFRMRAGQIVEHSALRDDLGLLQQLS
jgi:ketosteroid isomerase-like protein